MNNMNELSNSAKEPARLSENIQEAIDELTKETIVFHALWYIDVYCDQPLLRCYNTPSGIVIKGDSHAYCLSMYNELVRTGANHITGEIALGYVTDRNNFVPIENPSIEFKDSVIDTMLSQIERAERAERRRFLEYMESQERKDLTGFGS